MQYCSSDEAKVLKNYSAFFAKGEHIHQLRFIMEWTIGSVSNVDQLALGIINARIYLTPKDYTMSSIWTKQLSMFAKRDHVQSASQIIDDESKIMTNGHVWKRIRSELSDIESLVFRCSYYHWKEQRSRTIRILSISANQVCTCPFKSEKFYGNVPTDVDGFHIVTHEFAVTNKETKLIILALDINDAEQMLEYENTRLETIAVRIQDTLLVMVKCQFVLFSAINFEFTMK